MRHDLQLVVRYQATAYCDTEEVMTKCWAELCWAPHYIHFTQSHRCIFFTDHGRDFKRHMKKSNDTEVEYVDRDSPYTALYFAATKKIKNMLAERRTYMYPDPRNQSQLMSSNILEVLYSESCSYFPHLC